MVFYSPVSASQLYPVVVDRVEKRRSTSPSRFTRRLDQLAELNSGKQQHTVFNNTYMYILSIVLSFFYFSGREIKLSESE